MSWPPLLGGSFHLTAPAGLGSAATRRCLAAPKPVQPQSLPRTMLVPLTQGLGHARCAIGCHRA